MTTALAGYLAGIRGPTREAYAFDLRQFATCYRPRWVGLFTVRAPLSNSSPATWKPETGPQPEPAR
jgi:hypothetical protein